MLHIASFTFNPFQENTYVVHDGRDAMIVDPGCWDALEQRELDDFIVKNGLRPVRLLLTHAHIDHVLGNAWVHRRYGLLPELHAADLPLLEGAERVAAMYGISYEPSPMPERFLEPGKPVQLNDEVLDVLFVPGHAPGHIALHSAEQGFLLSGDVLFHDSIGRTDLPGGDTETLLKSIREVLFPLGDEVTVHSGHGPTTTIGREKRHNPFVRDRKAGERA